MNKSQHSAEPYSQFAMGDELDLPAGALAQAGATTRKNLGALSYGG